MSKAMKLAASAALITGLTLGAGATPAFAANSGCGSACDGQNPQTYTLDYNGNVITCGLDATTKKSATISTAGGVYVELRFSYACQTAWARTNGVNYRIYIYSYNSNGSLRRTETTYTEGIQYTRMVNDNDSYTAKACIVVPASGGEQICTAKY